MPSVMKPIYMSLHCTLSADHRPSIQMQGTAQNRKNLLFSVYAFTEIIFYLYMIYTDFSSNRRKQKRLYAKAVRIAQESRLS